MLEPTKRITFNKKTIRGRGSRREMAALQGQTNKLTGTGPGEKLISGSCVARMLFAVAAELGMSFPCSCHKLTSRSCPDLATSERMQIVSWVQKYGRSRIVCVALGGAGDSFRLL